MGKAAKAVEVAEVRAYLERRGGRPVTLVAMTPLGASTQLGLKTYGYGKPLRVRWEDAGGSHDAVLRTMAPDPYGHDRRSDRVAALFGAYDDFAAQPRHVRPLDVGTFDALGALVSSPPGEAWLLTEYVEGALYAHDLVALAEHEEPAPRDLRRALALADHLVALHAERRPESDHVRDVRDTIGSGEGLFGIADGWPSGHPVADADRLCRIEEAAVRWRWKLRPLARRARRTHGDFHPFNILFRDDVGGGNGDADFSVLDCSRRGAGEPADDVTCLAINYLFFALARRGAFTGALRMLWAAFWERYLGASRDHELLEVVAPFFAWRTLVVASPVWYPDIADVVRERMLRFAERLLAGERFDPNTIEALL